MSTKIYRGDFEVTTKVGDGGSTRTVGTASCQAAFGDPPLAAPPLLPTPKKRVSDRTGGGGWAPSAGVFLVGERFSFGRRGQTHLLVGVKFEK